VVAGIVVVRRLLRWRHNRAMGVGIRDRREGTLSSLVAGLAT